MSNLRRQTSGVAAMSQASSDSKPPKPLRRQTSDICSAGDLSFEKIAPFFNAPMSKKDDSSDYEEFLRAAQSPHSDIDTSLLNSNEAQLNPGHDGYHIMLPKGFRIDIGSNGAIRVFATEFNCAAALNVDANMAAIIHPNGRAFLEQETLSLLTGSRLGKITPRGVSFTAAGRALVFQVDSSGCKTTTEKFLKLGHDDFTAGTLYRNAIYGQPGKTMACKAMSKITYNVKENEEVWYMSGFKVALRPNGELMVTRYPNPLFICIAPEGQVKIKLNKFKMFIGSNVVTVNKLSESGPEKIERLIRVRDGKLIARCIAQEAGLDKFDELYIK